MIGTRNRVQDLLAVETGNVEAAVLLQSAETVGDCIFVVGHKRDSLRMLYTASISGSPYGFHIISLTSGCFSFRKFDSRAHDALAPLSEGLTESHQMGCHLSNATKHYMMVRNRW